jgi:hypothetical protein
MVWILWGVTEVENDKRMSRLGKNSNFKICMGYFSANACEV